MNLNFKSRIGIMALLCLIISGIPIKKLHAQANFWTIFGNNGCSSSSQTNRMTTQVSPILTSFLGTPSTLDYTTPSYNRDYLHNSMYDYAGNLLFSVNRNGIYNIDGSTAYNFSTSGFTTTVNVGGVDHIFTPLHAISEIVIFPVTKSERNRSYYVVFWARDAQDITPPVSSFLCELRAIKVDVSLTGTLTFTDNILYDTSTSASSPGIMRYEYGHIFKFAIAADASSCGESRTIYTLEPGVNSGYHANGWAGTQYISNLRKWTFGADGSLPSPTVKTFINEAPIAYLSKMKLLNISGSKHITYVSGNDVVMPFPPTNANNLITLKISDTTVTSYGMTGAYNIMGFEFSEVQNKLYVSYRHNVSGYYDPTTSGIGYFDLITSTGVQIPYTSDYANTDMKISKHGDLYLVKGEASTTLDDGHLAYLPLGSVGYNPATDAPTEIVSSCSTYISCATFIEHTHSLQPRSYYLGSQIKGENYGFSSLPNITIVGSQTWTPTSNPFSVSGLSSIPTIEINRLKIPADASLLIKDMTVRFSDSGSLEISTSFTATKGGKLTLDNTVLTSFTGCDTITGNMWDGVRLIGNNSTPQGFVADSSKQPMIKMLNNSKISYARVGILAGEMTPHLYTYPFLSLESKGGGIVQASNSSFENNHTAVMLRPYRHMSASTAGLVLNNISFFEQCSFSSTDPATIPDLRLTHLWGKQVRGIKVRGCTFSSAHTGPAIRSYGIWSDDMGFTVDAAYLAPGGATVVKSKFTNLSAAIDQYSVTTGHTVTIRNSEFRNNTVGIDLKNVVGAVIANNEFYIPYATAALVPSFPPPYSAAVNPTIGLAMYGCSAYSVYVNRFQLNSTSGLAPAVASTDRVRTVTGVLVWNNKDGKNELINNNTYV